jgi:hypothetical protein
VEKQPRTAGYWANRCGQNEQHRGSSSHVTATREIDMKKNLVVLTLLALTLSGCSAAAANTSIKSTGVSDSTAAREAALTAYESKADANEAHDPATIARQCLADVMWAIIDEQGSVAGLPM